MPIEGGAFYHADLVEVSRPVYNEHFTKILLAYSIWLSETKFAVQNGLPVNQSDKEEEKTEQEKKPASLEQNERVFFMLLGLGLEHLSNTTGLAQLSDETIEDILAAISCLLTTEVGRDLLLSKNVQICVEILSILYK